MTIWWADTYVVDSDNRGVALRLAEFAMVGGEIGPLFRVMMEGGPKLVVDSNWRAIAVDGGDRLRAAIRRAAPAPGVGASLASRLDDEFLRWSGAVLFGQMAAFWNGLRLRVRESVTRVVRRPYSMLRLAEAETRETVTLEGWVACRHGASEARCVRLVVNAVADGPEIVDAARSADVVAESAGGIDAASVRSASVRYIVELTTEPDGMSPWRLVYRISYRWVFPEGAGIDGQNSYDAEEVTDFSPLHRAR